MIRQWSYQQYGEAIPTHGGQSEVQVAKVHKSYTIFFIKDSMPIIVNCRESLIIKKYLSQWKIDICCLKQLKYLFQLFI